MLKNYKLLLLIMGSLFLTSWSSAQQKQIQYFSETDIKHIVLWDFFCIAGRKSSAWEKIAVPSNWEQQGFGNL